jgi:G3E family GTPase
MQPSVVDTPVPVMLITGFLGASDGVIRLANGCMCCSLEGDLLRTPWPEYIVI